MSLVAPGVAYYILRRFTAFCLNHCFIFTLHGVGKQEALLLQSKCNASGSESWSRSETRPESVSGYDPDLDLDLRHGSRLRP